MSGKEAAPAASVEINSRSRPPVAGVEGLPARLRICWGLACRGPCPCPGAGGRGPARPVAGPELVAGPGPVASPGPRPVAGAGAGVRQCTGTLAILLVAELRNACGMQQRFRTGSKLEIKKYIRINQIEIRSY